MACSGQKSLAAGHFASFQIHPNAISLHNLTPFYAKMEEVFKKIFGASDLPTAPAFPSAPAEAAQI